MNREGCVEMLQLGVLHVGMQPQVGRHAAQGSALKTDKFTDSGGDKKTKIMFP